MNKLISLAAGLCIALSSLAQSGGKVSGKIQDGGNQKVIDAASISLLRSKDSAVVKTAVSDKEGFFTFETVKNGNYLVMASSIGHAKSYSPVFTVSDADVNIGTIQLKAAEKNLKEVTVSGKRPLIERKADKTILNVEASVTNAGTTALDVLEKAPGVTVDKDGNVSLRGKQGVLILVDGKQTFLSGPELANMLRNMPSNQLDQVEIMTNPSAKYDASGKAGIINLKTKKNRQVGFNGNLNTAFSQGIYPKTNNGLNLNYRNGKVNIFGNLNGSYRKNFQQLDIFRRYTFNDKSTKAVFEQVSDEIRENKNISSKVGLDYYASKKTTIGFVVNSAYSPTSENGFNTSYLKNPAMEVDSIVTAKRSENNKWKNLGVNLNLRHVFDSTGTEITADADYMQYSMRNDQLFDNTSYTPSWLLKNFDQLEGNLPTDINIYSIKTDFSHPLKKGAKLEAGLKSSYVTTSNVAGYYNVVGLVKNPDYEKINSFDYKENINAAYINLNKAWKKWSLQTGLRAENTNYKGNQFGNPTRKDSTFDRTYTSLFPTLFASYNASEKNQYSFSYGRRINRPDYEDLNPFLFFLDKYTYGAGNPFLKPMFSHVLEASHTFKQKYTTSVNYSYTKDLFTETFEERGFATIVRQDNYGRANDVSVSFNAQLQPKKWWNANLYTEAKYNQFVGKFNGNDVNIDATTLMFNATNSLTFKKGWSAEVSGWYRTKGVEGQIQINPLWSVNAGLQKQVMKNKATIKLNIRDVFFSQNASGNINFQNTEARFSQRRDSRFGTLSFTYRFGKPIKGLQKRKTGGAGDEQNRVKTDN